MVPSTEAEMKKKRQPGGKGKEQRGRYKIDQMAKPKSLCHVNERLRTGAPCAHRAQCCFFSLFQPSHSQ